MSIMRRPLGHGPVPCNDVQEERVVRGRTAAERAAEETLQQRSAPPADPGSTSARRILGAGPGA
ncbi:hypothetical protein [Streptomyces goshikiensis]|uniref:hypothetical protein n=1 Tax=Streptomyces goshikiensis TaxID=1942 RepID=UPI002E128AF5|nr:hypothetical protein OG224_39360 [Streptomyces goshikiensis]